MIRSLTSLQRIQQRSQTPQSLGSCIRWLGDAPPEYDITTVTPTQPFALFGYYQPDYSNAKQFKLYVDDPEKDARSLLIHKIPSDMSESQLFDLFYQRGVAPNAVRRIVRKQHNTYGVSILLFRSPQQCALAFASLPSRPQRDNNARVVHKSVRVNRDASVKVRPLLGPSGRETARPRVGTV